MNPSTKLARTAIVHERLRRPLVHAAALSFVINLLLLAPALFMLQVFDRVLSSRSADTLIVLVIGVGAALLLTFALDVLRSRLQGVAGNLLEASLAPLVVQAMVAHGAQRGGKAGTEGVRDLGTLRALFSSNGLLALFDLPWIPVYVGVIALAHPWLGAAAAASAVLLIGLAVLTDRLTRARIDATVRAASLATRDLETSLANAEVAQVMGMTPALLGRWQARSTEVHRLQLPTAARSVALAASTRTLRQGVQVLMLAVGAWLVISGEASAGIMIATTTLLGRALAPVEQLVGSWRVLAEARVAWRRVAELLDGAAGDDARMALPAPHGALAAHQVVVRAPEQERMLLAGVSLHLEPGESLAVIGASGAGKSTLIRVLSGVWKPHAGAVRLDGADLGHWPREALGPHLGYVPQDVQLFAGTVAENIARMGPVDADAVVRAAQAARCHEMILSLPQGYDTRIDPGGAMPSPGQRQRIAMARALYAEPKLVLLDEPNANLDGAGEQALAEALAELQGKATVVVVTHRQALVAHVDKMLVLDAGRVQHFGTVADVLAAMNPKRSGLAAAPKAGSIAPTTPSHA